MENQEEQRIQEKLDDLLGLQDKTSSYFKVDIEKDALAWLKEFCSFLSDTEADLAEIAGFDTEDAYEFAFRHELEQNDETGYAKFRKKFHKPSKREIQLLKKIRASPLVEMECLTYVCSTYYEMLARILKPTLLFLRSVHKERSRVDSMPVLGEFRSDIQESLPILYLMFDEGYTCLYRMTGEQDYTNSAYANKTEDQLLSLGVFAQRVREHSIRTRLRELAVRLRFALYYRKDGQEEDLFRDVYPLEAEWSCPMSKANMMKKLHFNGYRTLDTYAKEHPLRKVAGNRQLWQIRIDRMDSKTRGKFN